MNQKILASVATILAVGVIAGGVTYAAYWTKTRTSTNNTFSLGEIDLQLSSGGAYATEGIVFATASNLFPGKEVGPFDLYIKNTSSLDGFVKVEMTYQNAGTTEADNIAKYMLVTSASLDDALIDRQLWWAKKIVSLYPGTNDDEKQAAAIADRAVEKIADGTIVVDTTPLPNLAPTLFGMSKIKVYYRQYSGGNEEVWSPSEAHKSTFRVKLSKWADNSLQGKSINAIANATIMQAPNPEYTPGDEW